MVAQVIFLWMPLLKYRLLLFLPADFDALFRKSPLCFPVLMRKIGNIDTEPTTTFPDDNP
jgi:hypothetical protein